MATPVAGLISQTSATGGAPLDAIAANQAGGYIVNPVLASDQGLSVAEPLFINQVTQAGTVANGTTIALEPGQTYSIIPSTTSTVSVAAASPNHKFTSVMWPTP